MTLWNQEPKMLLTYKQGNGGAKSKNGHHDGTVHSSDTTIALKLKLLKYLGLNSLAETHNIKISMWNCRSIRDPIKKAYQRNLLILEEIDIAILSKTFLVDIDNFFLKDFIIYRSDCPVRRKGTALLFRKDPNIQIEIFDKDKEGRYLKLSVTNRSTRQCRTFATCYWEPAICNTLEIPEHILSADYFVGDLNTYRSALNKTKVDHFTKCLRSRSMFLKG